MPFWLSWILLGLIAGIVAQLLYPKYTPRHLLVTVALGVLGGGLGGWLGEVLSGGFGHPLTETMGDVSILVAVIGANALIIVGGWQFRR